MDKKETIDKLLNYMLEADRIGANDLIKKYLQTNKSVHDFLSEILDPVMVQFGLLWGREKVSLSQAFVAAKIAEDIFANCEEELVQTDTPSGVVVLGNIEDDFHSLGRRMVIAFLRTYNWIVHDMGNDVLAEELVDKAVEVNPDIIGVSAMMQTTALNIKKVRLELDKRKLSGKIKLAVGGAVFNWRPELVAEVGGDGTARDATGINKLFLELMEG